MFVSSIKNWWSKKRPNLEGNDAPVTKQPGKEDEEEEDELSSQRFIPLLSLVWVPIFQFHSSVELYDRTLGSDGR